MHCFVENVQSNRVSKLKLKKSFNNISKTSINISLLIEKCFFLNLFINSCELIENSIFFSKNVI
jgi:hypothetical protein